jgi:hypothetical protein
MKILIMLSVLLSALSCTSGKTQIDANAAGTSGIGGITTIAGTTGVAGSGVAGVMTSGGVAGTGTAGVAGK